MALPGHELWIIPDGRGLPPSVEQKQFTEEDYRNTLLETVHPEGEAGPGVMVHQDAHIYASRLEPGVTVEHLFDLERGGYFYLIRRAVEFNGERLTAGDPPRC